MSSPILVPPNSNVLSTFRAAEWAVQVNTGTAATPEWTWVNGLDKFEPSNTPVMQDDTDLYSDAYKSQIATAQALDVAMSGKFKGVKGTDGTVPLDPGLAHIREAGKDVGDDNIVHVRYWRTDDLDEAYEHFFGVNWKDVGGSIEALQTFTATLTGRGKPKAVAKPTEPVTP
jgi:hypothetical protein